ncbi:Glutamyl-tRNA(Gln) amidotransferase subunit A [[Clostridium] cellulosi]|uniref:Glutamyl-tRNA(Gln) amidotransferase subunit A n=1 Tax=[Clostridium] cellulosi TaxID=29343 RepID=A0A078KQM7_9FIRM|nr:Glutamyl-tRNA(Gln) amidotransferase subunit A [[Clostridium] cellulosi]
MDLYKLSVKEASELLKKHEIKADELLDSVYARIEAVDGKLGAYISLCREKAESMAKSAQSKIDNGEAGALTGIPAGIKDNICTKGIATTCASKMLENFIPPYNATVIEKLESSGAVITGKLNMDEFAMGGSTETSYFKKCANPWDITRVPGGSSGGSASAVASGEALFALGSDTGGSIRQPASFCGVVGLKPTYGAVSRFGLVAFASSLDQIGPITRTVEDSAIVLNAICGADSRDSTCADYKHPDYTADIDRGVKGMKIGIPTQYIGDGLDPDVKEAVLRAAKHFEDLGAKCDEVSLPAADYAVPAYYLISSAEASSNLARYDGIKFGYAAKDCKNLAQLMDRSRGEGFGREVKRRIILGTYALSAGYYDAYYKKALKIRRIIKNGFDKVFENYDLIIGPTAPTTAYPIGSKSGDPIAMYLGDIFTVPVNIAGIPAMSLNCGFDKQGMPIGLQIIAPAFNEPKIFRAAYAFEKSTPYNKFPNI